MYNILKLNDIDKVVTNILPSEKYTITKDCKNPDAIILRSFDLHGYEFNDNLLAVARAGAGTNNVPINELTAKGIPVFNSPGANANAVKELVFCAMLSSARNYVDAVNWTNSIPDTVDDINSYVESGKKQFIGPELIGKTLGVIGLGAIGRMVANTAISLGMKVLGYDPYISIDGAWSLSSNVIHITDINKIFKESDFITLHVPLTDATRELICESSISKMKSNCTILNFARGELVNNDDVINAINNKKIKSLVTDFADKRFIKIKDILVTPHLGASTKEAETECAKMAANELKDYIENGNITNSVNYPCVASPRNGKTRITILHKNISNMIARATAYFSSKNINIDNILSSSKNDIAYMMIDIDGDISDNAIKELSEEQGFLKIRILR